jgi:putative ABC transport system ATP-binding protein
MEIFQGLNENGITIIMVTHEADIAAFAKRNVVMRDGLVRSDRLVHPRSIAREEIAKMPAVEEEMVAGAT